MGDPRGVSTAGKRAEANTSMMTYLLVDVDVPPDVGNPRPTNGCELSGIAKILSPNSRAKTASALVHHDVLTGQRDVSLR